MNKKNSFIFSLHVFVLFLSIHSSWAQKSAIEENLKKEEALSHFSFLASDELKGRDAARMEIDIAARYIAEQFEKYGAKSLEKHEGYYQFVPLIQSAPPQVGEIIVGDKPLTHGQDMLVLGGQDIEGEFDVVNLGYGLEEDYEGQEVSGKWVVTRVGKPDRLTPSELFEAGREKRALAKSKGALGLIEMYNVPNTPWGLLANYLNRPQMGLDPAPHENQQFPYVWVKDLSNEIVNQIEPSGEKVSVIISGKVNRKINGRNVVAWIEGTDPELREEYIMLSAHYDHLGVGQPNAEGDSIYNGARDNAVGTVALINAAQFFAENPPKRSVLLCAWTAEEKGLLGSSYFSENPPVPLNKVIYNLNIDNAGYNDTSVVTVIGLGRTSADHHIKNAVSEFGLEAIPDPAPEQGLYDRSDNVNFAKRGIPAPTFSLGFTAFDEQVGEHYHQPSDRFENFDLEYALLYWKSYILAAQKIANDPDQPLWMEGDKYEEAGKALYQLD
jgi:hypothetical protein